jgi:acetolactate synthase-1/2/3 large subunit
MTGADYIAEFIARIGSSHVFTLNGGACAFMVDAVGRHPDLKVICVQNEQAAAMAADAVWRVSRRLGVTIATSGPGATNLVTGIACSYFDSVPSLHITGQVSQRESRAVHGAKVRQSGFQETRIVEMVQPITKHATLVGSVGELAGALTEAYRIATSGRMGPVVVDVPMDVQQAEIEPVFPDLRGGTGAAQRSGYQDAICALSRTLAAAARPIVLWGGGVAMAGVEAVVLDWLERTGIPFVCSWAGLSAFSHDAPRFLGPIGVYGNRGANFAIQNADTVIVLGSRLDNRQRSGNPEHFATGAVVHVVDVDQAELDKYGTSPRYRGTCMDLAALPQVLPSLAVGELDAGWLAYAEGLKHAYFGREVSTTALRLNSLSPYEVVRRMSAIVDDDAVIAADTGAAVCWLYQSFRVKRHRMFTAGGHSPMGYALCAAIGAKLQAPDRQVIAYIGDGGLQVNIQELQTIRHLDLSIAIVVMNNSCYGIIKQFQDSYLGSRYLGSQLGYSAPSFERIAAAYGIGYARVTTLDDLTPALFRGGPTLIDVILDERTQVEPKLEMGRPINDQSPYLDQAEYDRGNRYVAYPRVTGAS